MKKRLIASILLAAVAQAASADGLQSLEGFMKSARTGRSNRMRKGTSSSRSWRRRETTRVALRE